MSSTPEITPAAAPAAAVTNGWNERIAAFATAVNKTPEVITLALTPLVGEPSADALAVLSDATAITDADLQAALVGGDVKIPLGVFRKNLVKLRGAPAPSTTVSMERGPSFDMLPTVPEDVSFLEMLKVGGVPLMGTTEVISAVKAALANSLGVFDLPDTLLQKMADFAKAQKKPVGPSWYKLRKTISRRNYADILSALDIEGFSVTVAAKEEFLDGLNEKLWAEVHSFYQRLKSWNDTWTSGMANPGMALSMLVMAQGGARGPMPAGMMQPPETAGLRDAAEALIEKLNEVFAGTGIPVARALAYDATKIKEALEDSTLPSAIGAADREQMLKMLGVTVGADYVRLERNITKFVLSAMELPKVTSGDEELRYLGAMLMLGGSIPWEKLPGAAAAPRAGLGRTGRNGHGSDQEVLGAGGRERRY